MTTTQPARASRSATVAIFVWLIFLVGLAAALGTVGVAHAEPEEVVLRPARDTFAPRRHHVRMALELGAVFAIGNRWYWRDNGKPNEVDWQLPWGTAALEAKLADTDGWRFDGNAYDINALGHPGFGMLTHVLARRNGYGMAEAFAISTLASGTWEVFLEWAEYGSLNDMAVTSTAGVPLGETAYQLLRHRRDARVAVHSGVGTQNGATFAALEVQGALDLVPRTGRGWLRGGERVGFAAAMPTDAHGVRAYTASARTWLAGHYQHRGGRALVAGVTAAFGYLKQADRPERAWDLQTTVGAGPAVEYKVRRGGVTVALGADLHVEFAMLKSEAFATWRDAHPLEPMRNVMTGRAQPYYFAVGASARPRLELAARGWVAGGTLAGSQYGSLDGRDRDQEMLTTRLAMSDRDASAQGWVGTVHRGASIRLTGLVHRRDGHANDVASTSGDRTATLTVGFQR